jgi:hypothetical protein
MDRRAMDGVDAIIHLAGAGVAEKRWTTSRKKELFDSRVRSTEMLRMELARGHHQVKAFISASAVGYYGAGDGVKVFFEEDPPGTDFLAQLTKNWEEAAGKIRTPEIRVVNLRIGIALSSKGGALPSLARPVRLGFGSALGDGRQFLSWVHIDDLCEAFIRIVEDETLSGSYNVAGTQPVTNLEMTQAIAKVLKKALWAPRVPAFILRLLLGEMAFVVLTGSKVSSEKLLRIGFQFRWTNLDDALRDLLR